MNRVLPFVYPQMVLTAGILLSLLGGLGKSSAERRRGFIMWAGIVVLVLTAIVCIASPSFGGAGEILRFDMFTKFFILLAVVACGLTLLSAGQSAEISPRYFPEFTTLLLTIGLGISFMAAAQDLLLAYLAMETVSLSSYVLTGLKRRDRASHEAALKYMIYGSVASGAMIFGMSLLYGMTGTTSFSGIAQALAGSGPISEMGQTGVLGIVVALILIFMGFLFKIAAVPFHHWCPDVYQGAPTPFTGFLSVAPKAAGFALILRFVSMLLPQAGAAIQGMMVPVIGIISAVTMTLGNFTALYQKNVKRLLAYSSIAHSGYILMAVTVLDATGSSAALLYLAIYVFMNIGAFAVVQRVADTMGSEELPAFRGLGSRAPLLAIAMAVFLFSLAGIPPLGGFVGKFFLFASLIGNGGFWYVALAMVGILNSVIALFYYAIVVREMFLRQSETDQPIRMTAMSTGLLAALGVIILVIGLYWGPLLSLARSAAASLGL